MAKPRDPAVTEYVRDLMGKLIDSKKAGTQEQIARKMGVSPSFLSQLWSTGVGGRSIDAFAKILNFPDADALRSAAYEAYRNRGRSPWPARAEEPAVQEALVELRQMYSWVSEEQWPLIIGRFAHPDFSGRPREYWVQTLTREVWEDKRRADEVKGQIARSDAVEYAKEDGQRGRKKVVAGEFRAKARAKRDSKKAASEAEAAAPVVHAAKAAKG